MHGGKGIDWSAAEGQEGIDTFYLGEVYDDTGNRVGHLPDEKSFWKGGRILKEVNFLRLTVSSDYSHTPFPLL